jgi:hypothetical protein
MSPIPLGIFAASGFGVVDAYDFLQTVESSSSNISFTGLGSYSDYKHLQIRFLSRGTGGNYRLRVRLNGSTTNYYQHKLAAVDGNFGSQNESYDRVAEFNLPGAAYGDSSLKYSGGVIDILDFANTSGNTTVRSFYGKHSSEKEVSLYSGLYSSTAAITSIQLIAPTTGLAGRYSIYGIRG